MRKFHLLLTLLCCFSATSLMAQVEEDDEDDNPSARLMFEKLQMQDPALGKVPWDRMRTASEQTARAKQAAAGRIASLAWSERGPNGDFSRLSGNSRPNDDQTSGRIRAVMVDLQDATHKTVFAGSVAGGLWKTTDITAFPATWTLVNDELSNLAIGAICQDPRPGFQQVMYMCTGESYFNADAVRGVGVFKSTDGGVNWNFLPSTSTFLNGTRILCDNAGNVYVGTRGSGLQRSTDGGGTWTNIMPTGLGSDVADLEISNTGRMHVTTGIFSTSGYRFTDAPSSVSSGTWTSATAGFTTFNQRTELGVNGNTLYACPDNASHQVPTIWKSADGGVTWVPVTTQPGGGGWANGQGWYDISCGVNPVDANQCIVGGLECYKTTDGGSTWTKIAVWVGGPGQQYIHADQHDVQWWDGGNKLMFACDGGIFYSSDGGVTIRDRNKGLRIKQFYSVAIHPTETNNIIAGAQDNGMHRLNHPGLDSSIEFYGGDGMFCAIDQNEPQYQFGSAFNNNIRRSLNGGNSWGNVGFVGGRFVSPWDYDNTANKIYLCNGGGNFIRWDDPQTGTTASSITVADFGGLQVSAVHVSPYTANRVYFGTSNGTVSRLVIADNANTATPTTSIITPPGASGFLNCIITGSSDQHIMACFSNFGVTNVFVTADGGTTWTACDGNLPDMPVRWGLFHPDTDTKAYIATATGVWETDLLNGASTVWTANASFPNVSTDMIKYRASDRLIAAATHGRGIWTTNIPAACPTASVLSVSGPSTICNGGTANLVVTVTGGQAPFTVVYNDGTSNFTVNNYLSGANIPVTPTVNTTYSLVSVTDANLCAGSGNSGTPLITVNPVPTVNAVANLSYCNNASVPSVVFTSPVPGATFSWSRTAEAIGLGTTSGSGNVPAFTGTNAGAAPLTATFTVTASYTNNGVTCTGAPTQFTITIAAPITATATPSSQSVCTGTAITTIVMSGSEPTAVYNWTRDNTVSVTGIAASGSGNISGTMTNSTAAPITVTFTITPTANGCPGTPTTATVVVSPIPVITISPTSANICPNTIVPISVTGGSPPTAQSLVTASGTISLAIPDNTPSGLTSNLTVPALPPGAVINSVDVKLNIAHTWDGDLIINLKAPNGEVLNLVNGRGGSGDNFTNTVISSASAVSLGTSSAPFTGTFAADASALNPATGYTPTTTSFPALFGTGNGTWTLAVRDNASTDFGTLVNWSITINFTAAPPPPVWTPITGLFSDAGATIPYVAGTPALNVYAKPTIATTYTAIATVGGCSSAPVTSAIVLKPEPTAVATPSAQSVCSGTAITTIVMSGLVPLTNYNWTRDNTVSVTGIAASGSGNISGTLTNTTTAPVTVTFTITPDASGCSGTPITVTVIVKPIPSITVAPTTATVCQGTITPINITAGSPGVPANTLVTSGAVNLSIPDNLPAGLTSAITVPALPAGAVVTGVDVNLNITHTWDGDLIINLKAPNGQIVNLVNGRGGSGDNFTNTTISSASAVSLGTGSAPFTGTFAADFNALNPATGYTPTAVSFAPLLTTPNGTWTLALRDNASTDFGTLGSWSITINYTVIPPAVWSPLTGLFTDPSGTVAYTGTPVTSVYANPATTTTYSAIATLNGCPSPPATTVITVNPVPTAVATPGIQSSCSGLPITNIVLSGAVPATTYNWTRNNTVSVTGIAASGSGNITGTLTNTTSAPVTVTFTITPSTAFCTGTPITATVTVNPIPVITIAPTNTTICAGTPTAISVVSANPGISGSLSTSSGAISVSIPDNTPAGISAAINVPALPAGAVVTGVDVTLNVTHTWDGDLIINLKAPNGQVLNLVNGRGGSGDNFTNTVISSGSATSLGTSSSPFTGTFAADASALNPPTAFPQTTTSFPALYGTGTGTWTLALRDNASTDFGTLTNWVVTVNYTIPPPAVWSPLTGLYLDAAMAIPYAGTPVQTVYAAPNTTTTYTAIATVNGCNSPPVTALINVNPVPTAVATPASQSICTGTAVTPIVLTGAVPATTFNWTRNNTATVTGIAASGAGNITGTLTNTTASPVTVTFTITPTAGGCTGTPITATVVVNPLATITCPANISVTAVGSCTSVVSYTPTVTGVPAPTLTYSFSGATTGSGNGSGSGSAFRVGVTTVTITATNTCNTVNCSFTVTVIDGQIPNITQQPASRTVCAGTNTTFTVTSTNVVGYQWQQWNGTAWVDIAGANTSSLALNNVTIAQNATSYRVIVIGLCTNTTSAFATLAVNPLPTVSISASQNPLLPNQTALITATANPAAGSYAWFFNGVLQGTTGATYGPVTIDDQGAYRVVFTDPNGCVATSNTVNITGASSPGIWVYPNPNRGVFQVRFFNTANEQVNVIVYSSTGQKVFQKAVTTGGNAYTQMEINISGQPAGVYVVNLVDGSGNIRGSRRIIVNLP